MDEIPDTIVPENPREMYDMKDVLRAIVDNVAAVIAPRETRPTIIRALEMLSSKREQRPYKKHGNIPV
jgi:acetyl-CoA carboxylase carboxyltransferase component